MDEDTGLIRSVSIDGEQIDLKQELLWYAGRKPEQISRISQTTPSGAYLFRPNQTDPFPLVKSKAGVFITIHKGRVQ